MTAHAGNIIIPRQMTRLDRAKSKLAPLRPKTRVAGGWLSDMVALQRVILLCSGCEPKFGARTAGYRKDPIWEAVHPCDGCKQIRQTKTYLPEETWEWANPQERGRPVRGRWALPKVSEWQMKLTRFLHGR